MSATAAPARRGARTVASAIGAGLTVAVLLLALIGPFVTPYQPASIDLPERLLAPSPAHWLGTDELGRDLFSRIANGGRYSLLVALSVVGSVSVLGSLIGGLSAIGPRWADAVVMRACDIVLSVPALVLAMALAAALGPGLENAMIALVVARIPAFVRLARNQALVVRHQAYMEAAELMGAGPAHNMVHHVLPNIGPVMLVQGVGDVSGVILASAALGFIGLGAQPPTPEWGALVASGRLYFLDSWWYGLFPGLAIAATAIGFNLLADVARDLLDPHGLVRSPRRAA